MREAAEKPRKAVTAWNDLLHGTRVKITRPTAGRTIKVGDGWGDSLVESEWVVKCALNPDKNYPFGGRKWASRDYFFRRDKAGEKGETLALAIDQITTGIEELAPKLRAVVDADISWAKNVGRRVRLVKEISIDRASLLCVRHGSIEAVYEIWKEEGGSWGTFNRRIKTPKSLEGTVLRHAPGRLEIEFGTPLCDEVPEATKLWVSRQKFDCIYHKLVDPNDSFGGTTPVADPYIVFIDEEAPTTATA